MNAPVNPAALAPATFQEVDLGKISLSKSLMQVHRRASLDKEALKGLTENVRQVGVIEPVLLRPLKDGFELVAGERRFLAAQGAKLKAIPSMVRQLTDQQALELQVIENKQREDLHELIEAEGFEELIKKHGFNADSIAAKIGMSRRHVFNRLKLLDLCPEARTAFLAGNVHFTIAMMLARIPVADLQARAMKEILKGNMSTREASQHLQEQYMLRLDQAPFKTGDETLVPKAGACGPCPKRTGNQPELFGDIKSADVCTDPVCFAAKRAAWMERLRKEAEARGQEIITGPAAKKIFPYQNGNYVEGPYTKLDDGTYLNGKHQSYKAVLGKDAPMPVLVENPLNGRLVEVWRDKDLEKALKEKGVKVGYSSSRSGSNSAMTEQRRKERRAKVETAIRREIMDEIRKKPIKLARAELVMIAVTSLGGLGQESRREIARVWGWKEQDLWRDNEKRVDAMDDTKIARLLLDVALAGEIWVNTYRLGNKAESLMTVAKKVGVNADAITKKHMKAHGEKEKAIAERKRKIAANAKKKAKKS